jgi:hypothetical protein
MKRFKDLKEDNKVQEPTGGLKDACWKGYTAVGMKMKGGKKVPNCVPVKEETDTTEKVEMTQSQLHFIHYACEEILDYIDQGGEVEEWYQVKVAKSFSEFESLHSFIEGEKRRTGMVKEAMAQPDYSQSIKARQAKADRDDAPFDADKKPVVKATPGKKGLGASTAKHLAKMAMQKQMKKEDVEHIDEVRLGGLGKPKNVVHVDPKDGIKKTYMSGVKASTGVQMSRQAADASNRLAIKRDLPAVNKKLGLNLKREEVEQIDEISSELAGKVSDARFKRVMSMDRNDPKRPEASAKFSRSSESARKRITRDMIKDPEKANRGFASDADKNTKRGWSNESVELEEGITDTLKRGVKNIKRGLQGWSGDTDLAITGKRNKPKDVVNRTKEYDTDTLKSLRKGGDTGKGSPAALQQKVIHRELKKRGVAEDVELQEADRPGMKDGRPYSDPLRRHPGNESYMTPEYMIKKHQERLSQIASGPYKRTKEVAQLNSRITKLKSKTGMKEEVEQIDELSKKTLGNYVKSASHDVAAKAAATRQHSVDAHRKNTEGDFTGARDSMKKSDKSFSDSWKRRNNMAKAVDRLTKEEDERMTEPFVKTSRKAQIVKDAAKKKKGTEKFESEPVLSSTVTRNM